MDYGESIEAAVVREASEELGIFNIYPKKLMSYIFQSEIEKELVNVYCIKVNDDFIADYNIEEIDDARFWHFDEIESVMGKGILTPNFEQEYKRIISLIK